MALGLDIGSSSAKVLGLDRRGRVVALARRPIATRRAPGGRVEHDAAEILRAALAALRAAAPAAASGEAALGIAAQRSTVLFWDRDTGRPLTPAYSWQDLRGAPACARLRRSAGLVAERTGLRLSPHYAAAKIAWALRNVGGLRRRLRRGRALWGTLGCFLLWRLSEGAVYAIDQANAQRTSLFRLVTPGWDPDLFALFGLEDLLDVPALPALLPTFPAAPIAIRVEGRSLRLAALTGDQQAALLGMGCRRPGEMAINYGSGAFVLINVGERPLRVPGLLTTLLASWSGTGDGTSGAGAARYAAEGPVNAAATAIDWVLRRLRLRVRTRGLDRFLGPDDGRPRRVHFLPAVSGLGAPGWDPAATPRFAGDLAHSAPRDLLRAAVESIAYRCAEILRAAAAGGAPCGGRSPVPVAGGLTRCRALLQAQADLLQRRLLVCDATDATAAGAALLALQGSAGTFAVRRGGGGPGGRTPSERLVLPRLGADEAEARYRAWKRAVYGRD
jgi:glycerol kinase